MSLPDGDSTPTPCDSEAPAKAIQELAGHKSLATTQRCMHLSPRAIESAIRLLDQPGLACAMALE